LIIQIDSLRLPASIKSTAELFNRDSRQRAVSGRLIAKLAPTEKWRVTANYEDAALSRELQAAFYSKCLEMRRSPRTIRFISPYDGSELAIMAMCVSRATPSAFNLFKRKPEFYIKAGAVFEEV